VNPVFEAFELAAQYRQLAELLAERHDDESVIADTLESIAEPLDARLENLAKMVRNLESAARGVEETISYLEARHASLRRAAERGRKLILDVMRAADRDRATTALFSIAVKKNPMMVVVDDMASVPEAYLTYHAAPEPTLDKRAIAVALKSGIPIAGVHGEQDVRLEIH